MKTEEFAKEKNENIKTKRPFSEVLMEKQTKINENISNKTNATLIIKPKINQNYQKTKIDLAKYINPACLDVNIKKINELNNGNIQIQCENKEEIESLKKEVESKMSNDYTIQSQEKRNPRLKIIGLEQEMEQEELRKVILNQNKYIEDADLKIIVVKKMKIKYMAIVEIDGENFLKIIEKGMLFINFTICPVFEYYDIHRCYKCTGYNHSSKNCTKNQVCMKCGISSHEAPQCSTLKENLICPNCNDANLKYNLGYFINHSPFDLNCQIYQNHVGKNKLQINYNSTPKINKITEKQASTSKQ